jgi:hypothetical protein
MEPDGSTERQVEALRADTNVFVRAMKQLREEAAALREENALLVKMINDLQQDSLAYRLGREAGAEDERTHVVRFLDGMARGPLNSRSIDLGLAAEKIKQLKHLKGE